MYRTGIMVNMIIGLLKKYKEVILYLVFGVATTVVNWISYASFNKMGIGMNTSNVLAWVLAVVFAYITNKIFVFESKSMKLEVLLPEIGKFVGARVVTGVIEIVGLPLLVYAGIRQTIFGVEGFLAKILVSVLVVILNYVFSKIFVFKD